MTNFILDIIRQLIQIWSDVYRADKQSRDDTDDAQETVLHMSGWIAMTRSLILYYSSRTQRFLTLQVQQLLNFD